MLLDFVLLFLLFFACIVVSSLASICSTVINFVMPKINLQGYALILNSCEDRFEASKPGSQIHPGGERTKTPCVYLLFL